MEQLRDSSETDGRKEIPIAARNRTKMERRESSRREINQISTIETKVPILWRFISLPVFCNFRCWTSFRRCRFNEHGELKGSLPRQNPDVSKITRRGGGGSNRVGWVLEETHTYVRTYVQRNWVDLDWIQSVLIPGAPSIASLTSSITFTYTRARTRVIERASLSFSSLVPCRNSTGYSFCKRTNQISLVFLTSSFVLWQRNKREREREREREIKLNKFRVRGYFLWLYRELSRGTGVDCARNLLKIEK